MTSGKSVIQSETVESPSGKVLLVVGDAAEVIDTVYPLMRLQEAGYQVVVAGPDRQTYCLVQHQRTEGWTITQETAGYGIQADIAFRDVNPEEYAGILVSGGRAPEYIRYDEHLLSAVRWMCEARRPVGSVCHGIEVLATADVIRGKRITTVPKCRFDAEVCGATYIDAAVVVDGLLVTARGALDGWQWMREFVRLLEHAEP
jgi:protease I